MFPMISKYKKLPVQVRASFWFLICSFLQKGISAISTPIFTRLMETSEYGNYTAFNSWLNIITIFVSLELYAGVYTQGLIKFEDVRKVFSSSLQGLSLTLTVAWTAVYLLFHQFWNKLFDLTTVQMLCMLVMIWATACFNFWAAEQRVEYKYRALVIVTAIVSFLKPAVGVVFVFYAEDKVTARILGLTLVELIGYTGLFFVQLKQGKVFFSKKFWRYAVLFNLPLVPHYLSQTVLSSADRIMIRNMVGPDQAGIYGLAYSVSLIMKLFNTALSNTVSPWMYQKIKDRKVEDIKSIAYITLIMIAIFNLILIVLAPEVITIFAPKAYYDAIWIVPPVAMSVYYMFMYDYFARFEFYYEKTRFIMLASLIGAIANIVLNYIFIPKYGYLAAGYTTLVCYMAYVIAHYWCMQSICKQYLDGAKVYSVKKLFAISFTFMITGFAFLLTYNHMYARYAIVGVAFILCVVFRKQIMHQFKNLLSMRKTR